MMSPRHELTLPELPHVGRLIATAALNSARRPQRGGVPTLPDRVAVVADHAQDLARLAAYDRVCGFGLTDAVPPTWLHVLTFPLQAALLSQPDFPFPLAGLVHLANDMTLERPVSVSERLRLEVSTDALADHRRGHQFDMVSEVFVGDERVWSGRSTYLSRRADARAAAPTTTASSEPVREPAARAPLPRGTQRWRLPADLGRQYAAVSGDVNPLHLYPLTARAFGFPRPIIHGMWTHARALAALGGRLPEAYRAHVTFTKPILLPAKVSYGATATASGWTFAVTNSDGTKPHLIGEVEG